jgi:hypothetical protein
MHRVLVVLATVLACTPLAPANAGDAEEFMQRFSGEWLGTGQILVGSENGLKFHCALNGDPSRTQLTFGMTGHCWMGMLSAPVYAQIRYNADTNRFYGAFMDGAEGDGVDVVGKRAGDGFSMQLVRGPTQGRLTAETVSPDQMTVMIFYKDRRRNRELPVVAMGFARKDSGATTLPDYLPNPTTGSVERSE